MELLGETVFLGGSKAILDFFLSGCRVLAQKIGALAKFGDFCRTLEDFREL
jgi:hypothetical protein